MQQPILSVTEVTLQMNATLEGAFPNVLFQGELGQITRAASGHMYFSLKDPGSDKGNQISCVMWRGQTARLTAKFTEGLSVICTGRPNIYTVNGKLQMVISHMEGVGDGLLRQRFAELKERLTAEGYFSLERKKPVPFFPGNIGLVTSGSGAALHDFMFKIRERLPSVNVTLVDVRVQGEGAANEIARAVTLLSHFDYIDVIVVTRGGGSLQDLWCFNEEIVVKAVFTATKPVISAVGHEVDITLSDLVADVRAPTPTAAGEMVVPLGTELLRRVGELERRLGYFERWFNALLQEFDEKVNRFGLSFKQYLQEKERAVLKINTRLLAIRPVQILSLYREKLLRLELRLRERVRLDERLSALSKLQVRIMWAISKDTKSRSEWLLRHEARLLGLSPKKVLERGYAVLTRRGNTVTSVASIEINEELEAIMHDGKLKCLVTEAK
jgi:exodeoxyribonuclease VII large subunit